MKYMTFEPLNDAAREQDRLNAIGPEHHVQTREEYEQFERMNEYVEAGMAAYGRLYKRYLEEELLKPLPNKA